MQAIGSTFLKAAWRRKPDLRIAARVFSRAPMAFGLLISIAASPIFAQTPAPLAYNPDDWSDLEREAPYGSEKEAKYRINALVVEEEVWDRHYSLGALGLFRYTDYPPFVR